MDNELDLFGLGDLAEENAQQCTYKPVIIKSLPVKIKPTPRKQEILDVIRKFLQAPSEA